MDPAQQLFNAACIDLADSITHRKQVSGAAWQNANQSLPEGMIGGLCLLLDDQTRAWYKDKQQHPAVGPDGLAAVVMLELPGIGVMQELGNAERMLAAIADVKVGSRQMLLCVHCGTLLLLAVVGVFG